MEKELTKIVKEAGKLLLENFNETSSREVLKKKLGPDYSIKMDKKAEDFILDSLSKAGFAGKVITEETGRVKLGRESEYTFYLDPLDGTLNYSRGIPHFCTQLGVVKNGKVLYGFVYDPNRDELFTAERNHGTFLNGEKIRVLRKTEGITVVGVEFLSRVPRLLQAYGSKDYAGSLKTPWCIGLNLCYTACGRYDATITAGATPWDIVPGGLIVEEAGAVVTNFGNEYWKIYDKTLIASSNKNLHKKILKLVR